MKHHWIRHLPEVGRHMLHEATYQETRTQNIAELEAQLADHRALYAMAEEELKVKALHHWTQDEINEAIIKANESEK